MKTLDLTFESSKNKVVDILAKLLFGSFFILCFSMLSLLILICHIALVADIMNRKRVSTEEIEQIQQELEKFGEIKWPIKVSDSYIQKRS